ncbi:hypothetical protein ccbrp13_16340 [Ktedonobacteria bacterium brp13]|nr:hypothetical protein ccbrp13_16340 [Ktedonobacteria bacterium brp13]
MQPAMWKPSGALSQQEEQIVHKIQKAKLFVFLRKPRHFLVLFPILVHQPHSVQKINVLRKRSLTLSTASTFQLIL